MIQADGIPSVTSSIESWCTEMDGNTVTQDPYGVDTAFRMYKNSIPMSVFWLSARNWYESPIENECTKREIITKDECSKALNKAMISCYPNSGEVRGASHHGVSGLTMRPRQWNQSTVVTLYLVSRFAFTMLTFDGQ